MHLTGLHFCGYSFHKEMGMGERQSHVYAAFRHYVAMTCRSLFLCPSPSPYLYPSLALSPAPCPSPALSLGCWKMSEVSAMPPCHDYGLFIKIKNNFHIKLQNTHYKCSDQIIFYNKIEHSPVHTEYTIWSYKRTPDIPFVSFST